MCSPKLSSPLLLRAGLAALAGALAIAPAHLRADEVTLESIKDNTLYGYTQDDPRSNGSGPAMFIGRSDTGNFRRALVQFNLASIPAGSTINSVTVSVSCTQQTSAVQPWSLHRVLASWGESFSYAGGSGGTGDVAATGDCTWYVRHYPDDPWTNPGGDFVSAASATGTMNAIGRYTMPTSTGLVADVQGWVNAPATNFGWIIRGGEGAVHTAKRLASREATSSSTRPKLVVNFTPAPACGDIDFNSDGLFPDTQDIDDFLNVFAGQACSTGSCDSIDFNNDGLFPDTSDIDAFLRVFAGQPC